MDIKNSTYRGLYIYLYNNDSFMPIIIIEVRVNVYQSK